MPDQRSGKVVWAQVGATAFLGVVGLIFTGAQHLQQEKSRKAQTAVQLMSERERSETDFRQKMFQPLIEKLLDQSVDVRERVTIFRLFQNNFHDIFNGRALFDTLENDAQELPKKEAGKLIGKLISLAKEVTQAQEQMIGGRQQLIKVTQGKPRGVSLNFGKEKHEIEIELVEVGANAVEVKVTIHPESDHEPDHEPDHETDISQFGVSYFDAPLTDNTLLPDRHRFAITLKDTNTEVHPHTATLNVLEFPAHYLTTGYKPSIQETHSLLKDIK